MGPLCHPKGPCKPVSGPAYSKAKPTLPFGVRTDHPFSSFVEKINAACIVVFFRHNDGHCDGNRTKLNGTLYSQLVPSGAIWFPFANGKGVLFPCSENGGPRYITL